MDAIFKNSRYVLLIDTKDELGLNTNNMRFTPVPDYHMHTPRCNHASGSILNYAEAALQAGLTEIGISDHAPMPDNFDAEWRMHMSELDHYRQELKQAQQQMLPSGLTVRCALEADFHPDHQGFIQQLTAQFDWDYIIGSVHFIKDWGFDNPDDQDGWKFWSLEEAWCAYFDAVAESAASGIFDIIGHPDLLKKYGHLMPINNRLVDRAETRMLESVLATNATLEISSAGLRKPVAEIYPHNGMIAKAAHMGIPFSFGSDAHAPSDVGHGMQLCIQTLIDHGIRHIASFKQRQRCLVEIRHVK